MVLITRRLLRRIASLTRLRRKFLQFCRQSCGSRIGGRTKNRAAKFCAVALASTGTNTLGHFHRLENKKKKTDTLSRKAPKLVGPGVGEWRRIAAGKSFLWSWAMDYVITGCLRQVDDSHDTHDQATSTAALFVRLYAAWKLCDASRYSSREGNYRFQQFLLKTL